MFSMYFYDYFFCHASGEAILGTLNHFPCMFTIFLFAPPARRFEVHNDAVSGASYLGMSCAFYPRAARDIWVLGVGRRFLPGYVLRFLSARGARHLGFGGWARVGRNPDSSRALSGICLSQDAETQMLLMIHLGFAAPRKRLTR